jgi:aspartyl protease family protein
MSIRELSDFLSEQPLLALAVVSIFITVLGGMLRRSVPVLGRFVGGLGNLGLAAALLLTIVQVARFSPDADIALPQIGLPQQVVEGGETRVPIGRDGHFWIEAKVNGAPRRFLVDTGATLTAVSPSTAEAAALKPNTLRQPVMLRTANGTVTADLVTIGEMRFGNVVARDLDAVVAPGMGEANVIGMNLLTRLTSWRVEGRTLILVPKHPQGTKDQV